MHTHACVGTHTPRLNVDADEDVGNADADEVPESVRELPRPFSESVRELPRHFTESVQELPRHGGEAPGARGRSRVSWADEPEHDGPGACLEAAKWFGAVLDAATPRRSSPSKILFLDEEESEAVRCESARATQCCDTARVDRTVRRVRCANAIWAQGTRA